MSYVWVVIVVSLVLGFAGVLAYKRGWRVYRQEKDEATGGTGGGTRPGTRVR